MMRFCSCRLSVHFLGLEIYHFNQISLFLLARDLAGCSYCSGLSASPDLWPRRSSVSVAVRKKLLPDRDLSEAKSSVCSLPGDPNCTIRNSTLPLSSSAPVQSSWSVVASLSPFLSPSSSPSPQRYSSPCSRAYWYIKSDEAATPPAPRMCPGLRACGLCYIILRDKGSRYDSRA